MVQKDKEGFADYGNKAQVTKFRRDSKKNKSRKQREKYIRRRDITENTIAIRSLSVMITHMLIKMDFIIEGVRNAKKSHG